MNLNSISNLSLIKRVNKGRVNDIIIDEQDLEITFLSNILWSKL